MVLSSPGPTTELLTTIHLTRSRLTPAHTPTHSHPRCRLCRALHGQIIVVRSTLTLFDCTTSKREPQVSHYPHNHQFKNQQMHSALTTICLPLRHRHGHNLVLLSAILQNHPCRTPHHPPVRVWTSSTLKSRLHGSLHHGWTSTPSNNGDASPV